jgi:hypothetical protein
VPFHLNSSERRHCAFSSSDACSLHYPHNFEKE